MIKIRYDAHKILFAVCIKLFILFFCLTPVFYYLNILQNISIHTVIHLYIFARILRILLAFLICYVVRQKNKKVLINQNNQRKQILFIIIKCIFFYSLLTLGNIAPKIYRTLSYTLGMLPKAGEPSFLAVLWEQLLNGDLFWAILLGCVIVFFPVSRKEMQ